MTDSPNPAKTFDLAGVWQQLSSRYDEQSLARAKQWVGKLMHSLSSGPPEQNPDANRQAGLIHLDGLEDSAWFDANRFDTALQLQSSFERIQQEIDADIAANPVNNSSVVRMFYDEGKRIDETFDIYSAAGKILDDTDIPSVIGEFEVLSMAPGWKVNAHFGPTNAILVGHLALHVPGGDCQIRVDSTTRKWTAGECLIFDDTFKHELWNQSDETHRILVFSLWHPDLTEVERNVINFFYPRISSML